MRKMKIILANRDLINFELLGDFEKCHVCLFLEAIACFFFFLFFFFQQDPFMCNSMEKIITIMHEKHNWREVCFSQTTREASIVLVSMFIMSAIVDQTAFIFFKVFFY